MRFSRRKNQLHSSPGGRNATSDTEVFDLSRDDGQVAASQDVPPDGGYGWVCAASVFLINANTWGVNSAWGVFLAHFLSQHTFAGGNHLQFGLIGGLSTSQALLVAPLVAKTTDRFGASSSLIIGTLLTAVSMLASSYATSTWHLFLSQGACFGYGMGFLFITASAVLPQWFSKRRSLALGIASSGAGFGGLAYNLGAGAGLESIGWRWMYRVLAICTLVSNLICSFLLKSRSSTEPSVNRRTFGFREFGHISILLIVFWGFVTEMGYIVLLYSLPNYAMSIGLSAQQGSIVGAVLNLGLAFGRPGVGWLSDRLGRINIATTMTALCAIFCLAIWVPAKSYAVLLLFALLSGAVTGTFWCCVIPVTSEVVGLQRLPTAFSMICLPLVLPGTFAEAIALQMASSSGYLSAQIFVGCMYLAGALSAWALRSWKVYDIEKEFGFVDGSSAVQGGTLWLTPRRLFISKKL